jgi:hypothetical protein
MGQAFKVLITQSDGCGVAKIDTAIMRNVSAPAYSKPH